MKLFALGLLSAVAATAFVAQGTAAENQSATVSFTTADGKSAGTATLVETPNGVLISADLSNLSAGDHGVHIHTTGKCDPDFAAAGGHFNPDGKEHGFKNAMGAHSGDLPNVHVAGDGTAKVDMITDRVTLGSGTNSVFDEDGSAIIIHAKADSYQQDPMAGGREACGVITK